MVYLNLSVTCIEAAIDFYANKLGVFEYKAGRLVCNLGVGLILDLEETDTERHLTVFGQNKQVSSNFWIGVGDVLNDTPIVLLEHLKRNGVQYEEIENLGGHHLSFIDPSGNKFGIHSKLGNIS
ncbi:VOC family protein [Marinicella rhabdoformis]|uniref:VOC family protein n=1 Tax=Marinicella rhabdoformis TaxID=2580566 RepID=UPI0012AED453|nr:VOC family protein [Marinicella rhabdoformis]